MGDVIKYEQGTVSNKTACIVYPDKLMVEVQLKGHKLQVIFNKNGDYIIKECYVTRESHKNHVKNRAGELR